MDYESWLRCEAVPLSNGILTRRSGLHYMKSPDEINAYYLQHFGTYWFNKLPKTDNVYSPTSKFHGCTLAPGIPLIPNLCRRPLRSPGSDQYEYSFTSTFLPTQALPKPHALAYADENHSNHINSLIEDRNNHNNHLKNGNSHNHFLGMTKLPRRRMSFHDSGLDSDSDIDDGRVHYSSQNTVTWLSWIITTVTTIITTVTETITGGRQDHHNHINTRVPLKQNEGISWYQYPVFWLYNLALYVHRADIWLLSKVNSYLQVDSWGPRDKRRRWALFLLLIPVILWAGYKLLEWLWGEEFVGEGVSLTWLVSPLLSAWNATLAWLSDFWGWFDGSYFSAAWGWFDGSYLSAAGGWFDGSYFSTAWGWFDGSWLWAPWVFVTGMFDKAADTLAMEDEGMTDEATEALSEVDLSGFVSWVTWPYYSILALFSSVGEWLMVAASALGEGSVTVLSSVGTFLAAVCAWVVGCVTSIPTLFTSALTFLAYPFKSMKWETSSVEYVASPAVAPGVASTTHYSQSSAPTADSVPLEHLLRDKQLLALLVRNLLNSEEFERAMAARHSSSQEYVNSAVNLAITDALSKFNFEFHKLRNDLSDNISSEKSSVEAKMESLKQQIHTLQEALATHKALVKEQADLGSKLDNLKVHEEKEIEKLKNQILIEVTNIRKEIHELSIQQSHQNVIVESDNSLNIANPSELEGLINSTVERLLAIYDADKIAKVDYALASSGGSVLSVRCTETYNKKNAQYYLMGYPLWSKTSNDPRIALEPAINPGECWAFAGSRGSMVIELSENITVTAFTLEHLPRSLSPSGTIDTAPQVFHVLGLESEQDGTPILLGRFRYEDNGVSLQHFQALEVDHSFKLVELVVDSNHGNLEYTCLYRFRVHGRPARSSCE